MLTKQLECSVYLYTDILALFAPLPYVHPTESIDLKRHLTNTCLQSSTPEAEREDNVRLFKSLIGKAISAERYQMVVSEVAEVVGETWRAALGAGSQFQESR